MTPTQFDKVDITIEELLTEQARLHRQADKMLDETGIISIFAKYGKLSPIGGSYSYGLMVYPDLDMDILANNVTKQQASALAGELIALKFVRKVSSVDNVHFTAKRPGMPKGYWFGIEIPFADDKWNIDLWLQKHQWAKDFDDEFDDYKSRLSGISPDQRAAILSIKYQLIRLGKYGTLGCMSFNIYDAVLDKGVLSLEDFLDLAALPVNKP